MPPHAYVPGVNARHPEGWFDSIKASVTPEMPVSALATTQAWRAGWLYFDAGFYWECHEVLEAVWMQTPDASAERDMVQAVIQLANARLKIRMQRPRAAWRLCAMVEAHLARCPREGAILGVPVARVSGLLYRTVKQLQNAK
ncbi:hypothetical protein SAMN04488523_110109 [Sulfitobacter brevis]|uniref:DUF309 domain-containing protein n=2 Tax=Sulfitobacter brevis TaxID=74348 RepID=A0A1I2DBA7_9RHOB|nr:hypothetical protein SAMN04488523_110109 [Sulfitobacter brevis]